MSAPVMVRLRDLGNWAGGNTPSKANPAYWTDGTVPWVSPKDMKVHEMISSEDRITELALADGRVSLVPEGSVLFVTRSGILSHTFPVAITKLPVTINQDLKALTPKEGVSPKYVAYAIRGASQRILRECAKNGTTVASIETSRLLDFEISIGGLSEQLEIVAEVEKQFSRLDEAVANLQRVKANLKRYKASVLNDAVEGRLVEGDYQYELVKLGSVANLIDPQPSHRTPPTHADGVPYIGIGDVLENGKVDLQNSRKVSLTVLAEHRARYTLRMGDFIFGKIGTLGKPTLLMPPYDYTLSANVVLVQADGVRLLPEYALIFMESPKLVNIVNRDAKATTQAAYGIKRMRDLNIELPNIDLQRRIIAEVDRRLSLIRGVVAEVDANLQRAQTLRISILATAFQSGAGGV